MTSENWWDLDHEAIENWEEDERVARARRFARWLRTRWPGDEDNVRWWMRRMGGERRRW